MSGELILVAEDEENTAAMLEYRLLKGGFNVTLVDNGREALDIALDQKPALCLLDVSMPGLNGMEVLRTLRSDPSTEYMKVILLSGRDHNLDIREAYRAGADDYLVKPVDYAELVRRIRAQLLHSGAADSEG